MTDGADEHPQAIGDLFTLAEGLFFIGIARRIGENKYLSHARHVTGKIKLFHSYSLEENGPTRLQYAIVERRITGTLLNGGDSKNGKGLLEGNKPHN